MLEPRVSVVSVTEKAKSCDPPSGPNGNRGSSTTSANGWLPSPFSVGELLTPIEAAQYLRLDVTGAHTPDSAIRTLDYWRAKGQLRATKYARRVWYRRAELDRFLERKTER